MSEPVWTPGWVPGQQLSAIAKVAANYAVTSADRVIEINAATQPVVATLPDAAGCAGQVFTFKRVDTATATNLVTIAAVSGQTIDGMSTQLLVFQYELISVVSDGTNWLIIESNYRGTELAYAETLTSATTTNTNANSSSLAFYKIPGLAVSVIGKARPVEVEFDGLGYHGTVNTPFGAALVINGATANGKWAYGISPVVGVAGAYAPLKMKRRLPLAAGTTYTFEIGMWTQSAASGQATFYADNVYPNPMSLAVIGQ